ncbi:hypothetical protein [Teredinibacter purpureus]|uniref:hypothetical protein n=1 Tax=Teredinibacter purpureus TaxID=2731756 RepID=UPI0005F81070|nr:hypothetical protein [Teredinibacter purpureus]
MGAPKKVIERLVTELTVDDAKMRRKLQANVQATKSWQMSISKLAVAGAAGLAVGGVVTLQRKVIAATIEQERAVKQLEQGLKTTGSQVGFTLQELTRHAAELQNVTSFGDEQFLSAQSKLATFTRITGDEFLRTTEAAADLAVRMETDLTSATVQLAKALNDPVANLGALSRAGIQFSDDQKAVIKSLWESGKSAEAQRVILKELEVQFGGSARAARDTFGGALKSLGNAAGDLLEADNLAGATDNIEQLTLLLQDEKTKEAAASLANALVGGFAAVTKAVTGTVDVVRHMAESLAAKVHGPAIGDLVRLEQRYEKVAKAVEILRGVAESRPNDRGVASQLANSEKELALLRERIRLSKELAAPIKPPKVQPGSSAVGGVVSGAGDAGSGVGVVGEYEKLTKTLTDQIALYSKTTEAARLRYQLENGLIEGLVPKQIDLLVAKQAELDKLAGNAELLAGIASFESELKTEEEKLAETYANRQQMLQSALDNKLITEARYADLSQRLQEKADDERRKSLAKGMESMLDIAGAYYDGVNSKEAGRARLAIQIGKTLLDDEKRNSIKKIAIHTYETAIKAYKSMAAIPYVGPALGVIAAGAVLATGATYGAKVAGIAHGGLTNVPEESTYVLQRNERVLSPNQNRDFTRFISERKKSSAGVVVHIHEAAGVKNSVESYEENGQQVVVIRQLVRGLVHDEIALQQEPGGLLNSYAV